VKEGISKPGAVKVPAGAGVGLSASMLYNAAKHQVESEYRGLDAKDAGFLGTSSIVSTKRRIGNFFPPLIFYKK
jgi:hypothetical protein